MPFNLSRRSITVITICSIVMTLLCLFYVTENDYSLINMKGTDAIANTAKDFLVTNKDEWETCLDPGNKPEYYLSIVIVTRMDDYAG